MIWNQLSWFAVPALSLWILGVLLAQRKGSPAPAFLATLAGWLVLSVFIGLLWRDLGRPPIRTRVRRGSFLRPRSLSSAF